MPKKILLASVSFIGFIATVYFLTIAEAQAPDPPISGRFYRFDSVAQLSFSNFEVGHSSINDSGSVAFADNIGGGNFTRYSPASRTANSIQ